MKLLLIDGHPDSDRLSAHFLDIYQAALPGDAQVTRMAIRDLDFDPILHRGYAEPQPLEPDLQRASDAILNADHIVWAFPLWWGAEPALLKGFLDRVLLPGMAFRYHKDDPWWDRLLAGRSSDVLITLDTPEPWLRLRFGNPTGRRLKWQVFGFCGLKPLRLAYFAPIRRGGAEKALPRWQRRIQKLASSVPAAQRKTP